MDIVLSKLGCDQGPMAVDFVDDILHVDEGECLVSTVVDEKPTAQMYAISAEALKDIIHVMTQYVAMTLSVTGWKDHETINLVSNMVRDMK